MRRTETEVGLHHRPKPARAFLLMKGPYLRLQILELLAVIQNKETKHRLVAPSLPGARMRDPLRHEAAL
jgi:hypothetical protein